MVEKYQHKCCYFKGKDIYDSLYTLLLDDVGITFIVFVSIIQASMLMTKDDAIHPDINLTRVFVVVKK